MTSRFQLFVAKCIDIYKSMPTSCDICQYLKSISSKNKYQPMWILTSDICKFEVASGVYMYIFVVYEFGEA